MGKRNKFDTLEEAQAELNVRITNEPDTQYEIKIGTKRNDRSLFYKVVPKKEEA